MGTVLAVTISTDRAAKTDDAAGMNMSEGLGDTLSPGPASVIQKAQLKGTPNAVPSQAVRTVVYRYEVTRWAGSPRAPRRMARTT